MSSLCTVASLLLASLVPAMAGAEPVSDTVLTLGKPSGEQTTEQVGDETLVRFQFNDRGRGPEISARWHLDAAGIPTAIRIEGKSYLKTPVDERFECAADGKASWHNENEQGERAKAPGAFYIPVNSPPALYAALVEALARAPGQKLPLLPAGEARLERVDERKVTLADGSGLAIVRYEIHGLDYTPTPVWLDADGRFFAAVTSFFSTVRKGGESLLESLLAAQVERDNARAAALAGQLARRPHGALLVRNARLFDPREGTVTPGSSVLVEGSRISAVGADASLPLPAEVETLDAGGRFLMPGLWDNHVHLSSIDGLLHLAAGVTSVRDMANDEGKLPARVLRFDHGKEVGPRVLMAGFMDGRGPFAGPTKVFVDTAEEARKWVDWYADHGYVQIKVYSSLKPELVPIIARLAHARGLRFSGHVPAFMSAEQFVRAGADELQHINFVLLNFLQDEAKDTRNMTRFTAIGEYAYRLSPEGERERAFIELLKRRHTVVDVTVNTFESMFDGAPGRIAPGYEQVVPRLPPQVARGMMGGNLEIPRGSEEHYAAAFPTMLRFTAALHRAGVTIIPGTDSSAGFGLHRELELWVRAGISPVDTLRAATLTSAEVNRCAGELGVVAPGKLADFILLDGDPTQRIADIRRVRTVVKDGTIYDTAALYAAVGVQPAP